MSLYRILVIIKKELLQLSRDRKIYPLIFLVPIAQLFLYGYAATFDIADLPLAVYDADLSSQSRRYLGRIEASGKFHLRHSASGYDELETLLNRGRAKAALVIHPGFGRRIREGKRAPVQLILDGTNSNAAIIAMNYLSAISLRYSTDIVLGEIVEGSPELGELINRLRGPDGFSQFVGGEQRIWYNQELKSVNFMIPGVIVIILMIMTMNFSAMSIVREKEIGTMEQLIATPIRSAELIVGKLAPYIVIGFIDSGIYPEHPAFSDTQEADRPRLCRSTWPEVSFLGRWLCRRFDKLEDKLVFEPPEN